VHSTTHLTDRVQVAQISEQAGIVDLHEYSLEKQRLLRREACPERSAAESRAPRNDVFPSDNGFRLSEKSYRFP
jgi:hypothetical protein